MKREEKKMAEKIRKALSAMPCDMLAEKIIPEIGLLFLGAPYRANVLEKPGRERLTTDLTQFDCMTFVETVLALARCAVDDTWSAKAFCAHLKTSRYRNGKIAGYASRLHYFSDWIRHNEKIKNVRDVSRQLGGEPRRKNISFMTSHRALYAGLKATEPFRQMRRVERNLSRRIFYVVDAVNAAIWRAGLRPGDIVALATDQEGLDVAHVGFAVKVNRHWRLLHASSREGAVVLSKETLGAYLKKNRTLSGMIVLRFCLNRAV